MRFQLQRRYLFPTIALLLVLGMALWQWLEPHRGKPTLQSTMSGVHSVEWAQQTLTLSGKTEPKSKVTITLGESEQPAAVDEEGNFVVTVKAEQKSPTRATMKLGENTYGILLIRLHGHWAALQRVTGGPASTAASGRGWLPAANLHDNEDPNEAGILTVTKDEKGYTTAIVTPPEHTTYVYSDNRLTGVVKHGADAAPIITTLPGDTAQMRLDIYDVADRLAQRLRLTMPPAESAARFSLSDGDLWILTDFSSQKGEIDEMFPGQFVPVTNEEPKPTAPAAGAATQNKAARPAQNAPAR